MIFDFFKAFDSIHREKMEEIQQAYGLPKETLTTIMMLYKNMKAIIYSSSGDTDFFDIFTLILREDTLAPYMSIICLDYILWMSIDRIKENGFTLEKTRSSWYPAETKTNADYTNDPMLLTITPAEAKYLLYNLEQAAGGISFYVNADKTEFMWFRFEGAIFTLSVKTSKSVDQITYLCSNISFTENDVTICTGNIWTALSDKIMWDFFQAVAMSVLWYGYTIWTLTKCIKKKLDGNYTRRLHVALNKSWK